MINQNFMIDFMAKPVNQIGSTQKKNSFELGSSTKFRETLDSALEKATSARPQNKPLFKNYVKNPVNRPENKQNENVKEDKDIKTFQDAKKVNDSKQPEKEVKNTKEDNSNKMEEKNENETDIKVKMTENALADVLGINVAELENILNQLKVDVKDIADDSKLTEVVGKISDSLGLDKEQTATLAKALELAQKAVGEVLNDSKNSIKLNAQEKKDWVKLEGIEVEEKVQQPVGKVELNSFAQKIKESLNKLESKIEKEPEKVLEGLEVKLGELLKEKTNELQAKEAPKLDETEKADETKVEKSETKDVKNQNTKDEKGTQEETTKSTVEPIKQKTKEGKEITNEKSNDVDFKTTFTNESNRKLENVQQIKSLKEVEVPKKEIINQVVEKAKVVLNGDKSEMVMDLKPEHLGKLSLKVVTERGIVVAKFTAESEQVKAAIESHMDTLKESLEKQGLAIQGFSVSVNQDNSQQQANKNFDSQMGFKGKQNHTRASATEGVGQTAESVAIRQNPYEVGSSRINLTA